MEYVNISGLDFFHPQYGLFIWAMLKIQLSFYYTGWFIGIPLVITNSQDIG